MRALPVLAAALCLAGSPALAQTSTSPAGGIPPATGGAADRTGSITATGQTKPPGTPVGERGGTNPELDAKSRELDRQIGKGICQGC